MLKKILTMLCVVFIAVSGCSAAQVFDVLPYTQSAVCEQPVCLESYSFSHFATDTGMIIPALEQNFVPQGIAYWRKRNWLILSGYFRPSDKEKTAVLLAVNATTGRFEGSFTLIDGQGRGIGGHFSGVSVSERDVFVTDGTRLLRVPLHHIERAGNSGALRVAEEYFLDVDAGSSNYSAGILWVCEHYQQSDYPLSGMHEEITNDGIVYHAWMVGYRVKPSGKLNPYCVFSVPDEIQGITVLPDGRIVLSSSYGRKNPSKILICDDPRQNTPDRYVNIEGLDIPLWYLDQANGMTEFSAPPMSEGCCSVGNTVFLIFESAAYFYRAYEPDFISLDPTDSIWKLDFSNKKGVLQNDCSTP